MFNLYDLLDRTRIPYFLCVGTKKNNYDSVGVLIGDKLSKLQYSVLGTTGNQLDAKTIPYLYETVISKLDTSIYQLICIDASASDYTKPFTILKKPIIPGSGVGKSLVPLGEISIHINIKYFIPDFVIDDLFNQDKDISEELNDMVITAVFSIIESLNNYSNEIEKRNRKSVMYADLSLNHNMTIRRIAKYYGCGKTTVHFYLHNYLPKCNPALYKAIQPVLKERFETKYIKGGESTKMHYAKLNKQTA